MINIASLPSAVELTIMLAVMISAPVQAAELYVDSKNNSYSLASGIDYLEDKPGQLEIDAIQHAGSALPWKASKTASPNFGFSNSTYWFRIKLINQNHKPVKLAVAIGNPLLDIVDYYAFSSGKRLEQFKSGDSRDFLQRSHEHLTFVFPVTVPASQPVLIYIRVSSEGSVQVPLSLWSYDYYHHHEDKRIVIQSLFFGALIFMAGFHLFIYLRTRSASHLFFVLYVISSGLLLAGLAGFGYKFIWQPFTHFQQHHISIFMSLSGIFLSAFIYRFLDLRKAATLTGKLLLSVIATFILLLLLTTSVSYHQMIQFVLLLFFTPLITGLYGGIIHWQRSDSANAYFTYAWVQFLLFILLVQLAKFGIISHSFLTDDILPWTFMLQVILLSMALTERMSEERRRRITAQKQVIELQMAHKERLEDQVQKRTQELQEANRQLELLATTDSLTGLYSRRYFLNQAEQLINISIRYQHPIAFVMLDIDDFKNINDTYGHAAGDHVLQRLGSVLAMTTRTTDITGRVGGEEFAIILIDASSSMAAMLIERLRQEIEKMQVTYDGKPVQLTVSAGVCTQTPPHQGRKVADMMKTADDALYHAKRKGKNCVITLPLP